jgi:hypothetical protein
MRICAVQLTKKRKPLLMRTCAVQLTKKRKPLLMRICAVQLTKKTVVDIEPTHCAYKNKHKKHLSWKVHSSFDATVTVNCFSQVIVSYVLPSDICTNIVRTFRFGKYGAVLA